MTKAEEKDEVDTHHSYEGNVGYLIAEALARLELTPTFDSVSEVLEQYVDPDRLEVATAAKLMAGYVVLEALALGEHNEESVSIHRHADRDWRFQPPSRAEKKAMKEEEKAELEEQKAEEKKAEKAAPAAPAKAKGR